MRPRNILVASLVDTHPLLLLLAAMLVHVEGKLEKCRQRKLPS